MGRFADRGMLTASVIEAASEIRFPGEIARPPGLPKTCSDADLMDAVIASMCGAELEELAPLLHVPPEAVRWWVGTPEWVALKRQVSPRIKETVHTELSGVKARAVRELGKRLRDGDVAVDRKTGEPLFNEDGSYVMVPVNAAVVANILRTSTEVLHELERDIGSIRDEKGDISLNQLVDGLRNLSKLSAAKDITGTAEVN